MDFIVNSHVVFIPLNISNRSSLFDEHGEITEREKPFLIQSGDRELELMSSRTDDSKNKDNDS